MTRLLLKYGLLSGLVLSLMLLSVMVPTMHRVSGIWGMVIGYTVMILGFLIAFTGVKHYRDHDLAGHITFGRAFLVGFLIMLIASVCYTVTWEVLLHTVEKNFAHDYAQSMIDHARTAGLQGPALDRKIAAAHSFETSYNDPIQSAATTMLEPLPVALIMALVTAGILRRKPVPELPSGALAN